MAGLTWLARMFIDAGSYWLVETDREYYRFWLKLAATVWCLVSCYLSFAFTDGLMLRWLFNYGPIATIIRLLTLNAFNYYLTGMILSFAAGQPNYVLPAWICISLILTGAYCVQDWLTSNISIINEANEKRRVNFLEIAVLCVVPVGLASFFTMVMLLGLRIAQENKQN